MKKLFLLFILSGLLYGQEYPMAPLMPLIPGDPLELSSKLHEKLYDVDQSAYNEALFQKYRIPWIPTALVLILMLLAPLGLYLWLESVRKIRKEEIPTFREILWQLKGLNPKDYSPRELSFAVAKLFKMGFEKGPAMTYQELTAYLHKSQRYSEEEIAAFQEQFKRLEQLQYQPENPSFEEVKSVIQQTEQILKLYS